MKRKVLTFAKKLSVLLSDRQLATLVFIWKQRYFPKFKNPRSLNEKINYIKLFNRNPARAFVADRINARTYVMQRAPECNVVTLLWNGNELTEEIWYALPQRFVLKANHGAGMVKIVDKKEESFQAVADIVDQWVHTDYALYGREWIYRNLGRYVIAEEKLGRDGAVPPDFKFFVLSGRVALVQVDLDRFGTPSQALYDRDFRRVEAQLRYPFRTNVERPRDFSLAVRIAEQLAMDFDFMRVDLYLSEKGVYFGELTNTPGNGFRRIQPKHFDFSFGALLPEKLDN